MQELQSLKNKILTLAIQGKLVPQEETDEPASVLLQKIQQEKERLIQEKKLKKDSVISSAIYQKDNKYFEKIGDIEKDITKEIPFEIPKNWQWVRLGILLKKIGSGSTPKGGREIYSANGIKFIRSQNVHNSGLQLKDIVYISDEINNQKKNSVVLANDVLLNITGASIGRCAVVPSDFDLANINQHVMILRLFSVDVRFWIHLVIISDFIQSLIMSVQKGSSKEALTIDKINQFLIPLPPLEEQKRIVKKVQELFTQVDCIEKNNQELDNLKATFKNKMLSLAIQGKLSAQMETEEPATILLQKIQTEKERLVKEKKCKKETVFSTIYRKDNKYFEKIGDIEKNITKEIPFEIPQTWQWVRLGNIVNFKLGKTPERAIKEFWNSNDIPWVSISDMTEQHFIKSTKEKISNIAFINKFNKNFSPKGTLLMSFKLTVGKTSILSIDAVHNEAIISIFPYFDKDNYFRNYLYMFLPIFSRFGDKKEAIKGLTLNSKSLADILIPLPPLEEQHRITQKIEEIFMLCEKL